MYFKQVFETVYNGAPRVVIALGDSYAQAKSVLGVDELYSVMSGNALQLSDFSWYGYDEKTTVNISVEGSSGYAMTNISSFDDCIYGYSFTSKRDDEPVNGYAFSTLSEGNTKKELSAAGIEDIAITGTQKLAVKARNSI